MGLFNGQTNAQANSEVFGYQVQTSLFGSPIKVVIGQVRIPGNVIWYGNWQSQPVNGGKGGSKGGKGGGSGQQYTYTASIQIGLCHGPIRGIGYIWIDKTRLSVNSSSETFTINGDYTPQNASTFLSDSGAGVSKGFSVDVNDFGSPGPSTLSGTQQVPLTQVSGTPGPGQYSIDPATGIYQFNPADYGFTATINYTWVDPNAATDGAPLVTPQDPSGNLGFALFVGDQGQAPWPYLISNFLAQALGYTGLAHADNENMPLGSSGMVPNFSFEILGFFPFGNGIVDADVATAVTAFLSDPLWGAGFPAALIGDLTELQTYCQANNIFTSCVIDSQRPATEWLDDWYQMANCAAVWSEGILKSRCYGDKTAVGNGVQFNPTTAPVYDLDSRDFLMKEGEKPIKVNRPRIKDAFNSVTIEWINRGNAYNPEPVEERDPWAVNQFGLRPDEPKELHCIMDQTTAAKVANTIVQRNVYIRNTYQFTVSAAKYFRLECMDMVTLTLFEQQLFKTPVRITSIQENENLELEIEAEEFPWGTATPTLYPKQTTAPFGPYYSANPGGTEPIIFFEPNNPDQIILGNNQNVLLIGLAGFQNWGGCNVYVSTDGGVSYQFVGRQSGASTAGLLTAALPAVTDPDNTSTLSLDMTQAGTELVSYTKAQKDALVPLAVVDQELIAYQDATVTGLKQYDLTKLRRALYESPLSAHSKGAPFAFFDSQMFQWQFPVSLVNSTVLFKFPAFNKAGLMGESLAQAKAYSYFIHGERGSYPWATHDPATPVAPNNVYRNPNFGLKEKLLSDVNGNITPQFVINGFSVTNKFSQSTVPPTILSAVASSTGGTIPGGQVVTVGCWAQGSDGLFTRMALISVEVAEGTDTNSILLTASFGDPAHDVGWVAISPNPDAGWWGPNVAAMPLGGASLLGPVQAEMQALGAADASYAGGLDADQWSYYWTQVTGQNFSGGQIEDILVALGLTDNTRGTIIGLSSFATAVFDSGMRLPSTYLFTSIGPAPQTADAVESQMASLGAAYMAASGATGLNPDQWAFYYAQVTGQPIDQQGSVMEAILIALGLTDDTRDTDVSLSAFLTAVNDNGVPVLDIEDLTTPVPDEEFDHFIAQARIALVMGANGGAIQSINYSTGEITFSGSGLPTGWQWIGRVASCYGLSDPTQPLPICDVTITAQTTNSVTIEPSAAALLSPGDLLLIRLTATGWGPNRIEDSTLNFWVNNTGITPINGLTPSFYKGKLILITRGTGAGQIRNATDNDGIGFDTSPAWVTQPDATSEFLCINSVIDYETPAPAQTFDSPNTPVELTISVSNSWNHFFVQVLTANSEGVTSDPGFSPYRLIFQPGFPGPNNFGKPSDTFYVGFGPGGTPLNIPAGGTSTLNVEFVPGILFGWDAVANVAGASDIVFDVMRTRTVSGVTTTVSIFGSGPKIVIPAGSLLLAAGTTFDLTANDIQQGDFLQLVVVSVDPTTPGQRATVNLYWKNVPATGAVSQ